MANFLIKKSKLIFFIYTFILASVFILGCGFMTNYKDIMVNYSINPTTGAVSVTSSTEGVVGTGKNTNLFDKFGTGVFAKDYVKRDIKRLEALIKDTKYSEIDTAEKARDTAYKNTMQSLGAALSRYVKYDERKQVSELMPYFVNTSKEEADYLEYSDDLKFENENGQFLKKEVSKYVFTFQTDENGNYVTNDDYQAIVTNLDEATKAYENGVTDEEQAIIDSLTQEYDYSRYWATAVKEKFDGVKASLVTVIPEYQAYIKQANQDIGKVQEYEETIEQLKNDLAIYGILYNGKLLEVNENTGYTVDTGIVVGIDADGDEILNEPQIDFDGDDVFGEVSSVTVTQDEETKDTIIDVDLNLYAELVYGENDEILYLKINGNSNGINDDIETNITETELYASGMNASDGTIVQYPTYLDNKRQTNEIYIKSLALYSDYSAARTAKLLADNTIQGYDAKMKNAEQAYEDAVNEIEAIFDEIEFIKNDIKRVEEFGEKYPNGYMDLGDDFYKYCYDVYDYRQSLNSYNDLIFTFGIVSIIALVLLFVFANHSRRIYYKSNLFAGLVLPLVPVVFGVVMIVKDLDLMSTFNDNYDLFNFVAVMQNNSTSAVAYDWSLPTIMDNYSCTDFTFILTMIIFIIIIAYSLFVMVYTLFRYKACAKERAEIIDRAVANND